MFFEDKLKEINDLFLIENKGNVYRLLVEALEKPLIERLLGRTRGNQLETARILGINRNTLRDKIKRLGIKV